MAIVLPVLTMYKLYIVNTDIYDEAYLKNVYGTNQCVQYKLNIVHKTRQQKHKGKHLK